MPNEGSPVPVEKGKRKLTVTSCEVLQEWQKKGSDKMTYLYKVEAVDEHGRAIQEELRSFAELEIGVQEEYEIEPYDHPDFGRSYTLKRPRQNTTKRVVALEQQVTNLADRLSAVEKQLRVSPPPPPKDEDNPGDNIPFGK